MALLDNIKLLCKEKGVSQRKMEQDIGISNGASSKWVTSSPSGDVLQKLSSYFNVSINYLVTGKTDSDTISLNSKDEKDIAKRLENTLTALDAQEGLMFSGEPLDDTTRELLKASLENSIKIAKINAKKFTPKKYNTSDPFELADALKIAVFHEELGSINGYYNNPLRMKQIHINSSLNDHDAKYTCAHELGHAIMHPTASTPFLRLKTLLSVNKLEIEANTFAVNLLIPDEIITENRNYTTEQLSRLLGYNQELINLRLKTYYQEKVLDLQNYSM